MSSFLRFLAGALELAAFFEGRLEVVDDHQRAGVLHRRRRREGHPHFTTARLDALGFGTKVFVVAGLRDAERAGYAVLHLDQNRQRHFFLLDLTRVDDLHVFGFVRPYFDIAEVQPLGRDLELAHDRSRRRGRSRGTRRRRRRSCSCGRSRSRRDHVEAGRRVRRNILSGAREARAQSRDAGPAWGYLAGRDALCVGLRPAVLAAGREVDRLARDRDVWILRDVGQRREGVDRLPLGGALWTLVEAQEGHIRAGAPGYKGRTRRYRVAGNRR